MDRNFKSLMLTVLGVLFAISLSFGESVFGAEPPPSLGYKIDPVKNRAYLEEMAAYYEQDAKTAQAKSDEHRQQAELYKKSGYAAYGITVTTVIEHCDFIARKYKEAADESLKMAKLYRDLAAKSKD